ncbi:MAG TPA: PorT family protein [Porphyromonadaceae bacterium]|nr:PorT family protein [Porphyromonadaceae bacterium]
MKNLKLVMVIAALFVVSTMQAQFRFGVKGGLNICKVKFNEDVFRSDNITGFHVGPTIEAMMGQGGIGLDAAVLYSQRGFDSDEKTIRNSYLDIPVNLKFKFGLPLVNPYLAAGPYMSLRVAGDKKWSISDKVDQIEAKSFGAGLNFTAGAEIFNSLQVGVTYSWGLTNDFKTFDVDDLDSYKGKAHTWLISAAVFF